MRGETEDIEELNKEMEVEVDVVEDMAFESSRSKSRGCWGEERGLGSESGDWREQLAQCHVFLAAKNQDWPLCPAAKRDSNTEMPHVQGRFFFTVCKCFMKKE